MDDSRAKSCQVEQKAKTQALTVGEKLRREGEAVHYSPSAPPQYGAANESRSLEAVTHRQYALHSLNRTSLWLALLTYFTSGLYITHLPTCYSDAVPVGIFLSSEEHLRGRHTKALPGTLGLERLHLSKRKALPSTRMPMEAALPPPEVLWLLPEDHSRLCTFHAQVQRLLRLAQSSGPA